jgi:ankyrin repeat protein
MAHLLIAAARRGHIDKIHALLATEAGRKLAATPLRGSRETALIAAARAGHLDCVDALLPVSDVGACCGAALGDAARGGHAACVRALLEPTLADPYVSTLVAKNAAFAAIAGNHVDCLEILLAHPKVACDVWLTNQALRYAARLGQTDCARLLLPVSDARAINKDFGTVLMEAAHGNHTECALLLLPHSDVNAADECGGYTAPIAAFERRNLELVRRFAQAGAHATVGSSSGSGSLLFRALRLALAPSDADRAFALEVLDVVWSSCPADTARASAQALMGEGGFRREKQAGLVRLAESLGRSVPLDVWEQSEDDEEVKRQAAAMLCALIDAHGLGRAARAVGAGAVVDDTVAPAAAPAASPVRVRRL